MNERPSHLRLVQFAAVGLAFLFAAGVVAFYLLAGGDDNDPATVELPFGGTPIPDLPGLPTPVPGTGMLEDRRAEPGEDAPNFALVDARDPSVIRSLDDFAGKPVVLNWYASWCGPCMDELPVFMEADAALGGEVQFLLLNFLEDRDDALSILDELGVPFVALLDRNGAVAQDYRIGSGLPVSMFIDADGVLRSAHRGPLDADALADELEKAGVAYNP